MLRVRCDRPDCGGDELRITERNGVEIDYCVVCRGVWLDRGELDKIIERSMQQNTGGFQQPPSYQTAVPPSKTYYDDDYDDDYRKRDDDYYKKKRKSSWLRELFDF